MAPLGHDYTSPRDYTASYGKVSTSLEAFATHRI
jgi:hypothetical protein